MPSPMTNALSHQLILRFQRQRQEKYRLIEKENQRLLRRLCEIARKPSKSFLDMGLLVKRNNSRHKYNTKDNAGANDYGRYISRANQLRAAYNNGWSHKRVKSSSTLSPVKATFQQGYKKQKRRLQASNEPALSSKSLISKKQGRQPQANHLLNSNARRISCPAVRKIQNRSPQASNPPPLNFQLENNNNVAVNGREPKLRSRVNRRLPSARETGKFSKLSSCKTKPLKSASSLSSLELKKEQRIHKLLELLNEHHQADHQAEPLSYATEHLPLRLHTSRSNGSEEDDDRVNLFVSQKHRDSRVETNKQPIERHLPSAGLSPLMATESTGRCRHVELSENQRENCHRHESLEKDILVEIGAIISQLETAIAMTRKEQERMREKDKTER